MSEKENKETNVVPGGVIASPDERRKRVTGNTFVFTSAQSNTKLHEKFWRSLMNFVEHNNAQLHISRFTYNKNGMSAQGAKEGTEEADSGLWYDDRIVKYISDESLQVAPDLVWCGELQILPTAVNPISGMQGYTRSASAIIPHAKMLMESVPTLKHDEPKFIYTTGACTQRNYIQKKAGQKADFHHVFGALVVEVDEHGVWWARQLNADTNGCFYDLTTYYTPSEVVENTPVYAITHGDLHGLKLDTEVVETVFSTGGVLDELQPKEQFFHDTIDFMPRNHHNRKDHLFLHRMYADNTNSVEEEFNLMGTFLATTAYRDWCRSFVVVSNHDQAVESWLRDSSALTDSVNVKLWLEMNLHVVEMQCHGIQTSVFRAWLNEAYTKSRISNAEYTTGAGVIKEVKPLTFLLEDDSYKILGEVEAALHGHLGPNGARGTPNNLRNTGKANTGHTHSAGIKDGVYTAGVYGKLDMEYNKGLSSWSHSMIVTYPNAKRAILTIKEGKAWRQ